MSLYTPLFALVNNDCTYQLSVSLNQAPMDISAYTPVVYIKPLPTSPDSDGTSFGVGTGLTVANSFLGQLSLFVPHTVFSAPATLWWRLDLLDINDSRTTVLYGPLTVKAV